MNWWCEKLNVVWDEVNAMKSEQNVSKGTKGHVMTHMRTCMWMYTTTAMSQNILKSKMRENTYKNGVGMHVKGCW